mmetsp:Transcript_63379/g.163057  ORF Transcript_63379/g.163057 Transcript_63379/m.163057 type:complete len:472 (+) Transcript_63379:81-1496(+)
MDEFTEVEEEGDDGPCGKIGKAMTMACLGIVLFPLSLLMLGWNENSYVCENNRILYADNKAVVVPNCDNADLMDKFVFLSCPVLESSLMEFTPCVFNGGTMSCQSQLPVKFRSASGSQNVEMYQCVEECSTKTEKHKNMAGQNEVKKVTTCTYEMKWATRYHDSSGFKYSLQQISNNGCPDIVKAGGNPQPPSNMDMGQSEEFAQSIVVGKSVSSGFTLNKALVDALNPDTPVPLQQFASGFSGPLPTTSGIAMPWSRPLAVSAANMGVQGNYLTTCTVQQLGCVRASYMQSGATNPSVFTHVETTGLTSKETIPGSWGCSKSKWQAIEKQKMDKAAMVESLQASNSMKTWVLRLVGCLIAWLSVYCCFSPISAAADVLGDCINFCPCGGYAEDLLEGVVDSVLCLMSCGIGCSCALFVIALVWVAMRPLVGGGLMAVALLLCCCVAGVRSQASGKKARDAEYNAPEGYYE